MTRSNLLAKVGTCQKSVGWKSSVQKCTITPITMVDRIVSQYEKGKFPKLKTNKKVYIYERGKRRGIIPIVFEDRIQQRCFCEYLLIPTVTPYLIYDNGASLKNKGTGFTRKRVEGFISKAVNKWGNNFYILKFDFRHYFDSISHKVLFEIINEYIDDEKSREFIKFTVINYGLVDINTSDLPEVEKVKLRQECLNGNGRGICLGSEISQVLAVLFPNELDHYIKEDLHMKYYARHVDDGVIIAETKEQLQEVLKHLQRICEKLDLELHPTKTKIVKASKGFTYLQRRYLVTDTGKIIIRLGKNNINRMKRKLRKFKKLYDEGRMSLEDIDASLVSWLGHCGKTTSYKTRRSIERLYNELF